MAAPTGARPPQKFVPPPRIALGESSSRENGVDLAELVPLTEVPLVWWNLLSRIFAGKSSQPQEIRGSIFL